MSEHNRQKEIARTPRSLAYTYHEYLWGDLISGSKNALQRLGIGVGLAFPGEKGGRKIIQTTDPRGFPCEISRSITTLSGFAYDARIQHPGREYSCLDSIEIFPGVTLEETTHYDIWRGSRESLVAGGFVLPGQFPGDPGVGKSVVRIRPNSAVGINYPAHRSGVIRKVRADEFLVFTVVSEAESAVRISWERWRLAEYEARMVLLPRAPRIDLELQQKQSRAAARRRAKLRLVWSKPAFEPGMNPIPEGPYRAK